MAEYIVEARPSDLFGIKMTGSLVRCKDCEWRGNPKKCIVAFVADKQEFPLFFYDNRGEWFCADGERREDDE